MFQYVLIASLCALAGSARNRLIKETKPGTAQKQHRDPKKNESGTKTRFENKDDFRPRFRRRTNHFLTKTGPEMRGHFFAGGSLKMKTLCAENGNSVCAAHNPISQNILNRFQCVSIWVSMFNILHIVQYGLICVSICSNRVQEGPIRSTCFNLCQ